MEDFLEFSIVHQLLEKLRLKKKIFVGQGYDGAASTSGQFKGVQQYITGQI
jgi:hypothetical protein